MLGSSVPHNAVFAHLDIVAPVGLEPLLCLEVLIFGGL